MPSEEGRHTLRHVSRILDLEQVGGPRQDERLGVSQPREQQLQALVPDGGRLHAPLSNDCESRLSDAAGLTGSEGPLLHRGQLLAEERICIRRAAFDGTGECCV
jgi:hypothetical protein